MYHFPKALLLLFLIIGACFIVSLVAIFLKHDVNSSLRSQADTLNDATLSKYSISGCNLALYQDGNLQYSYSGGFHDFADNDVHDIFDNRNDGLSKSKYLDSKTLMEIASCTKSMTAALIFHASEVENRFSIDDNVLRMVFED